MTATATDWAARPRPRRRWQGVNGFGWSGTNAHVVLEGYGTPERPAIWRISQAKRLTGRPLQVAVSLPEAVDGAIGRGSAPPRTRRTAVAAVGENESRPLREARGTLLVLARTNASRIWRPATSAADALLVRHGMDGKRRAQPLPATAPAIAVQGCRVAARRLESDCGWRATATAAGNGGEDGVRLYRPGQPSGPGMGKTLYEREPGGSGGARQVRSGHGGRARERFAAGRDVRQRRVRQGDLYDTAWAQPATYAPWSARLPALWRGIGVEPGVVIGHSLGEYAAAQAAGVFSLEDGLRFVAKRGALLASVPELGSMAAVFAPQDKVAAAVRAHNAASDGPRLSIGVDNGTHQVISGPTAAVQALSERFESEEVRVRPLRTNQAFHSVLVEPALGRLGGGIRGRRGVTAVRGSGKQRNGQGHRAGRDA